MVKLTRIYTRGGDKGLTSLGTGKRTSKHDLRVEAYGSVDEANAAIGLTRLHTKGKVDAMLARIQNDLFDLGADLATPESRNPKHPPLRIVADQTVRLEHEIDVMNAELSPLTSFVLRGGTWNPYGLGWFTQRAENRPIVWRYGLWPSYSALIQGAGTAHHAVLLANSDGLNNRFPMANGDVRVSPFAQAFPGPSRVEVSHLCSARL